MNSNFVGPYGWRRPLPYDLQRHITTKFLSKQERIQYVIDKFNSARGKDELKRNLTSLPPDTRIKLFINGIYNKFNHLVENSYIKVHGGITMPRYIHQIVRVSLDTIYYGYSLNCSRNTPQNPEQETPSFIMNINNTSSNMGMKYCPVEGHSELTDNIHVTDFVKLIHTLSSLKCPSKKFTEERDQIIYEFAVIVQMLATKYTKLKEQDKKDKLAAKEKAKQDKLAAKEKAKQDKLAAKEKAQKDQLATKEKTKQGKLVAKEKAQKDKLDAKEKAKNDKLAAKEKAKLEKANQKRELHEMRMQERKSKKINKITM
jgi:hypothetical protein